MTNKIISYIIRIGTIAIATITSFVITPPIIEPTENNGVHWKNIFIFIAGILSIVLYDKIGKDKNKGLNSFWLIGLLIILFISYETLYNNYSVSCSQVEANSEIKVHRCITTTAKVMNNDIQQDLDSWIKRKVPNPIQSLVEAYNCSPIKIWKFKDLAIPYYSFIFIYFSMIVIFILLIISVSDKFIPNEKE